MPAATRANQPTINSVFQETRRSSRRNVKKLESVESSLAQNTLLADRNANEPLHYVESPNITLLAKTSKPRTGNRSIRGKNGQVVVNDTTQSKLNFSSKTIEIHDDTERECVSKNEDKEASKEVPDKIDFTQGESSEKTEGTECLAKNKEIQKPVDTVEVTVKANSWEANLERVRSIAQTDVKDEDTEALEKEIENDMPVKSVINSGKSQMLFSTSRSQRMLLTVKQPDADESSQMVPIVLPDKASSKTKLEPGNSVPMQRNLDHKLLISPAKRKQLPIEGQGENSKNFTDTPTSPSKMSKKELFEKVDSAKSECKKTTELYLPVKYQMLVDQFVALETTSQILFNRKEQIQFDKVVSAVQTTTRRNFTLMDLAKLFRIQPNFYKATYEKKFNCAITKSFSWVLRLYPVLEEEKDSFSASDLISRRNQFFAKLVDIVHEHHFQFLFNLNSKLNITKAKILRWHPKFPIEKLPDIEPIELPEKPAISKPRQGLNELILKSKEKATEKLDRALAKIEPASFSPLSSPKAQSSAKSITSTKEARQLKFESNRNLTGIPEKLRLKIMAKEAVKAQEKLEMKVDQKVMNQKLPNVAKVIRVTFLSDKRCAIPQDEILSKCAINVKGGISRDQAERALKLIMECTPDWLSIVVVQSKHYVKVNKSFDYNLVVAKIQDNFPVV